MTSETTIAMAQTIGELMEGQRQLESRMDRLEARMDRLEAKVDKLIWLGMAVMGTTLATLVASVVA